jgi:alcohol dehydrogenase class IV
VHAGHALALTGLALAHAMAQALGGRYGIPHGAMNALCLPPALEFNRALVPDDVERFGEAIGGDAIERSRELALLGGFDRLRDYVVPKDDLRAVAEAASQRAGNLANPRPATPDEILSLLEAIW